MHIEKKTLRNIFIGVGACIILYWILHETSRVKATIHFIIGILSPFIIGSALAFIINVPMRSIEKPLEKIKNAALRRTVALLITFVCILMVLALVFWLLIPQVVETVESLIPKLYLFITKIETAIIAFLNDNPQVLEWIGKNTDITSLNLADLAQKAIAMVGNSVSTIFQRTVSAIGSISGAIVDVVIGLVFAVYCLFQKENLSRQGRKLIYAILPEKVCDKIVRVLRLTNSTFSNFLSGQCIEVVILGCLFAVTMAIFKMPYIPLVSVLIAVTAFIPVVGAWVGCVFGTFLILVANPMQAVWFVVIFIVLQQIENNLIYPRVVGTSIGLPGMWVLLAVAIGGELMGVAGMFLMIPVASVLYTLVRELVNNKLNKLEIDQQKLEPQEPDIGTHFLNNFSLKFLKKIKIFSKKK